MLELLMGRPKDMDPLAFDGELGMIEVKKPELPWLVSGLEGCALPAGGAGGAGGAGTAGAAGGAALAGGPAGMLAGRLVGRLASDEIGWPAGGAGVGPAGTGTGTLRGGGLGMTGLRMELEDGGDVAGGLALPAVVLLDWRQDATMAASD